MPRYFFDIKNGHRIVGQKGHECENDQAAFERGKVIAIGVSLNQPKVDPKRHVAVVNEDGMEVSRVPVYSMPTQKA